MHAVLLLVDTPNPISVTSIAGGQTYCVKLTF